MQLSILLATNRKGLLACSRIAQACSWASPDMEVIIRDNSGDPQKRDFLKHCQREHCTIVAAEPCGMLENFSETLKLAKANFIFVLADDDFYFDHAMPGLCSMIEQFGKDPSVIGVTGAYAVEMSKGSTILSYPNIESGDVTARAGGFLSYVGPNILLYAPLRRAMVERVFKLFNAMPALFSFHDQIICLMYLLNGKFVRLNRLIYGYEVGPWENPQTAQKRDLDFYVEAGLDPSISALHWFLCGFEGAVLVRNSDVFPDFPLAQRQKIADVWFSTMFARFQKHDWIKFESRYNDEAGKLREKFLQSAGRLSFPDLLKEICAFMALSSEAKAKTYFAFWDAVINKRMPPPRSPS